jgi:serine/threonine protein kinase
MNEVFIKGKRIKLDPTAAKGKGGEADIYGLSDFYKDGRQIALKAFKTPDHPDYKNPDGTTNINEQKGAIERLKAHQKKLPLFPRNLPPQVVSPIEFATDKVGATILGFTLEFLDKHNLLADYKSKGFRQSGGITNDRVCSIFRDLHAAVTGVHGANAVLGDFNDLNILVSPQEKVRIIDADSMQFGPFFCSTFTQTFVDPTLCVPNPDPNVSGPILTKPHNQYSDWYAFAVMLFQSLLFLDGGPYGGLYKPKDKSKKIPNPDRWQQRITVFNPEVGYPRPCPPMTIFPDNILHFFEKTFVKDVREIFPSKMLDLTWTVCNCGAVHARNACPVCQTTAYTAPTQVTRIRGKVKVTTVFGKPTIVILHATTQNGELKYLYHDGQSYRREDDSVVVAGPLDPQMRFRIQGKETVIGKSGTLLTLAGGKVVDKAVVDHYGLLPIFDTTPTNRLWINQGRILRNKELMGIQAPDTIGHALQGQTLFWVGPKFGFGFYRAGELSRAFVFDVNGIGINDSVDIPIKGQIIDSTCIFSEKACWFFLSTKEGSKIINHCHVIHPDGKVVANISAEKGTELWLDNIRGKIVFGNTLFVPTDDGLQRFDLKGATVEKTAEFPDTEQFVDSGSVLLPGKQGIYVVDSHEIRLLQMQP